MTAPELAASRALVTGATGHIGRSLVDRLERAGASVDAVSRRPQAGTAATRWHRCDLGDPEEARRLVATTSPDLVFHLAGEIRAARELDLVEPTFTSNLAATVNLMTAAAERSLSTRVLLAGSLEEPDADGVVSSPYAASKAAARTYADLFREVVGLPVGVLRIFMVYGPGPGHPSKLIPYVIRSLLRGEPPRIGSGSREIDWIYVDDVAAAFVAAAVAQDVASTSVDVGSGTAVSIREVVDRLVTLVAPSIEPEYGALPPRPFEQVRIADVDATERAIGWRPAISLDEGLARTVEWFRSAHERGELEF